MEPAGPSLAGIERVLRRFGGNPDTVSGLLGLVPLAVTNMYWRNNEVVEEWHVEQRLSDGDMLRINSFTTHEIGSLLSQWRERLRLATDVAPSVLESVTGSQFEDLAVGVATWMSQATRVLPTGQRLEDLAREDLTSFGDQVADHASAWLEAAEDHGIRWALTWAAGHGAAACRKWWGAPTWPERVSIMMDAIGEPQHPHWGNDGERWPRWELPALLKDRGWLREVLLNSPWEIESTAASWLIAAGLGWVDVADFSDATERGAVSR